MTDLVRLDIGWNQITALPPEIKNFVKLEELWVNANPLCEIPPEIQHCRRLKVLDMRDTDVEDLPKELSRLRCLVRVNTNGAPLKKRLKEAVAQGTDVVLSMLRRKDEIEIRKSKLDTRLRDGIYREASSTADGKRQIAELVASVFREFTDGDEQRNLIRNAERLFPQDLGAADAKVIRTTLRTLRRQNEKKKMAAELELKIRAIYFDRIKVETIEGVIQKIYAAIPTLEDIQFLLKYASQILPPHAKDIVASKVYESLVDMRKRLRAARASAVKSLRNALRTLYADVEPDDVELLLEAVSARFTKIEDIKKLATDASTFFPVEFESADAQKVRAIFLQEKRTLEGK